MNQSLYPAANRFVGALDRCVPPDGTRRLAELRRSLLEENSLYRVLQAVGYAMEGVPDHALDAFAAVAPLVALHKQKLPPGSPLPSFPTNKSATSLGASLRRLRGALGVGQESLDLRFSALLNAHEQDVPYHLRQILQRLTGHDARIPVDYAHLIVDLTGWGHPKRCVQNRWAKHYWMQQPTPTEAETQAI